MPVIPIEVNPTENQLKRSYKTIQDQFRHTLRKWQCPLFGSLCKAHSPNNLHQRLMQQQPIMLVSDASVQKSGHSGFAWIIAHETTLLWRGQGLAPGPIEDMHSGRAEAFGILAALTFLQHYISCYNAVLEGTTLTCFCDNLGVITNITTFRNDEITCPNDATNDDRDLILAINDIVDKCHPLEIQFMFVKGHQDTKADRPLTLEETYNVECDKLAKAYVHSTASLSTSLDTPEIDAAQPHLCIAGKIICRRFLPALREQEARPAYHAYLCQKYNWTMDEASQVNWEALNLAICSTHPNDQRRIVLFINGKLLLRTSKAHPHPGSQLCPSCQRESEDKGHFLECNNIHRRRLFENFHRNLTALAVKFTLHPSVLTALWLGLLAVRTRTPYPNIHNDVPRDIAKAIHSQTKIGWDQLYYGRLSTKWAQAIDTLHPTQALSGRQITTIIVQETWKYILETWTTRNQHLHNDKGQISLPDYRQAVQTMYETRHQLPAETQAAIFTTPIAQLLEQSPAFLCTWIMQSNKYIKQQLRAAKKRAKLQTPDIWTFFGPRTPVDNDLHPP